MLDKLQIIATIEDQRSVDFTGKINLLNSKGQLLGNLIFVEGDFVASKYKESNGLKSFYNLLIDSYDNKGIKYIVEPEIIENYNRNIHFPYSVLLKKAKFIINNYKISKNNRPPDNISIYIDPKFIESGEELTAEEFELMTVLIDFQDVKSIYMHCKLLEYEITNSLVGLRKKKALKVISKKSGV